MTITSKQREAAKLITAVGQDCSYNKDQMIGALSMLLILERQKNRKSNMLGNMPDDVCCDPADWNNQSGYYCKTAQTENEVTPF